MAESPAHKLGQIIGDSLEQAVRNELTQVVKEFGLYLDFQRPRAARDGKRKVTWQDAEGNTHVLVLALSKASREFVTVEDAVWFIQCYEEFAAVTSFERYELQVRYSNGDEIRGAFASKAAAVDFLRSVEP